MTRKEHNFHPLDGAMDQGLVFIDGYVDLSAAGAVVSDTILGCTVTHSGTGEYTFTLDNTYASIKSAHCTFVSVTDVDLVCQLKSFTGSTIIFKTLAGATPTDPSAISGLSFSCVAKRSATSR